MFSPVSYNWNHLLQMLIFSYSVYSCSSYSENWQIGCITSKNILKSKLKFKICSDATCNKNSFSQHYPLSETYSFWRHNDVKIWSMCWGSPCLCILSSAKAEFKFLTQRFEGYVEQCCQCLLGRNRHLHFRECRGSWFSKTVTFSLCFIYFWIMCQKHPPSTKIRCCPEVPWVASLKVCMNYWATN